MVDKVDMGLQICVEEMQKAFEREMASFEAVKSMARSVFSAASMIVALLGALQILTVRVVPGWFVVWQVCLGAAMVLYVALIVLCFLAFTPQDVPGPVKVDWQVLMDSFYGEGEKAVLTRLSSLVDTINANKLVLRRSVFFSRAAGLIFVVLVVLLLSMALIPRV